VSTRWGRMVPLSISAQAAHMQAHNSSVTHKVMFRDVVELTLNNARVRWRGDDYQVVSPPTDPGGLTKFTTMEVRKL
jgi:hypothetical protein